MNTSNRRQVVVTESKIRCPEPGAEVWNNHPINFLTIPANGSVTCPYCETTYTRDKANKNDN